MQYQKGSILIKLVVACALVAGLYMYKDESGMTYAEKIIHTMQGGKEYIMNQAQRAKNQLQKHENTTQVELDK